MKYEFNYKTNPRVIIIQKLYGNLFNKDEDLTFPKHRFKKFIKDIVNGTIERNDLITKELEINLKEDLILSHLDKLFQVIIKCAVFEFLYKPKTSSKIIIKEYLIASNSFLEGLTNKIFKCFIR
tara:strand:+ start:488 stop:859 length:372 start_codon:yes stop_codon:yes gene_type:complete